MSIPHILIEYELADMSDTLGTFIIFMLFDEYNFIS
jgi:hypothetical protein